MNENQKREEFTHYWLEAEPSVSAYVFASISSFHDAEDVVQRIAQELARRFDEFDSGRPFVGWAIWVAKSRVWDGRLDEVALFDRALTEEEVATLYRTAQEEIARSQ